MCTSSLGVDGVSEACCTKGELAASGRGSDVHHRRPERSFSTLRSAFSNISTIYLCLTIQTSI